MISQPLLGVSFELFLCLRYNKSKKKLEQKVHQLFF